MKKDWKKKKREWILDLSLKMMDLFWRIQIKIYEKQKKVEFEGFWWWILDDLYYINFGISDRFENLASSMIWESYYSS